MPASRKLRVFLCHSSNDKPAVRELYQRLKNEGWIDPWLDEEKLFPGQDWDLEIEKAVEAADAVIVFLSNNSVTKEGYVQRELRFVLRIADFKPEGTVFVIPVRLDDCPMPRRLSMWQYLDYFPEERVNWACQRLLSSLKVRANKLGISTIKPPENSIFQKAEEWAREQVETEERAKKEQEERERKEQEEKVRKEKEAREKSEAEKFVPVESDVKATKNQKWVQTKDSETKTINKSEGKKGISAKKPIYWSGILFSAALSAAGVFFASLSFQVTGTFEKILILVFAVVFFIWGIWLAREYFIDSGY
jgi:hypothetical protein